MNGRFLWKRFFLIVGGVLIVLAMFGPARPVNNGERVGFYGFGLLGVWMIYRGITLQRNRKG